MGICHSQPHARRDVSTWQAGVDPPRVLDEKNDSFSLNTVAVIDSSFEECLTGWEDGTIKRYNWRTKRCVESHHIHSRPVNRILIGPKSLSIFSCSRDTTISYSSANFSGSPQVFQGHSLSVSTIAIDENEQLLCSGGRDTQTILWDLTTGNIVSKNAISQNVVTCSRWIRGESLVVQGSEDLSLKIWDCRCPFRVPSQLIHGYVYFPLSVDISSDGNYILTSSKGFDGVGCEGRLWDRRSGKQLLQLNGHQQDATCCGFVSDVTSSIPPSVTASKDGYVKVWDSSGKVLCETQDSQGGMYTSLSISRKTDKFAHVLTGTFDGSVEMLSVDLKTNTIVPL